MKENGTKEKMKKNFKYKKQKQNEIIKSNFKEN